MLVGRERECARLDALIAEVRAGHSATLVVTGDAGVGKTSLLEYAAVQAGGFQVLRAHGVESEQDLPFAGLADLVGPILGHLGALPGPQRAALAGALAVGPVVPGGRFPVCAAALRLLSAAAAQRPVLAVVDDGHWLDVASVQVLQFCAHRLGQEAIGLVVAARPDSSSRLDTSRFSTIEVAGLDDAAGRDLLASTGRTISPSVAERLVTDGEIVRPVLARRSLPAASSRPATSMVLNRLVSSLPGESGRAAMMMPMASWPSRCAQNSSTWTDATSSQ